MSSPPPPVHPSFVNQDLRRHSFRRQQLQNGHFSGCDLRGCDFYRADLREATFIDCRTGGDRRRLAIAALPLVLLAVGLAHAVSALVFGALGTLPSPSAWPYVVALHVALAIATVGNLLRLLPLPTGLAHGTVGLSTAALMGFFYGGRLTDDSPTGATASAIGLGLVGLLLAWGGQMPRLRAMVGVLGAIAAYGLAFLLWVSGMTLFPGASGLGLGAVAAVCLGLTWSSLVYGGRSLWCQTTTSFRRADLRGCTFEATDTSRCDLTTAIR